MEIRWNEKLQALPHFLWCTILQEQHITLWACNNWAYSWEKMNFGFCLLNLALTNFGTVIKSGDLLSSLVDCTPLCYDSTLSTHSKFSWIITTVLRNSHRSLSSDGLVRGTELRKLEADEAMSRTLQGFLSPVRSCCRHCPEGLECVHGAISLVR